MSREHIAFKSQREACQLLHRPRPFSSPTCWHITSIAGFSPQHNFFLPTSCSQTRPPQTLGKIQHPMSYTVIHRDTVTGDDGYGQNSLQSEATAQPYSPEQERANAPPPPHCMRAVSVRRFFVFVSSVTIFFSRLYLPCTAPH